MANVVLDTEDLIVLGGPASIDVDVSFGPKGDRGSLIFSVLGDPNLNSSQIPVTPQPYDLAINTQTSDPRYLTIYQYISQDGVQSWIELAQLLPNAGASKDLVNFTAGEGILKVDVSTITDLAPVITPLNFGVLYSIQQTTNNYPISSGFTISPTFEIIDNKNHLVINFNAVEFNNSVWSAASGSKAISTFITVITVV
jgi:hypothetical protein